MAVASECEDKTDKEIRLKNITARWRGPSRCAPSAPGALSRDLFKNGSQLFARPAPGGPELDDSRGGCRRINDLGHEIIDIDIHRGGRAA